MSWRFGSRARVSIDYLSIGLAAGWLGLLTTGSWLWAAAPAASAVRFMRACKLKMSSTLDHRKGSQISNTLDDDEFINATAIKRVEEGEGQSQIFADSVTAVRSSPNVIVEVLAKVEGGWPITTSIRNILPTILLVLKPCKTIKNCFLDQS